MIKGLDMPCTKELKVLWVSPNLGANPSHEVVTGLGV